MAVDRELVTGIDWIGKALFAFGMLMASGPGVRTLGRRLTGSALILPLLLIPWLWFSAAMSPAPGPALLSAAELTLPIFGMTLLSVQQWSAIHYQLLSGSGTIALIFVAATGLFEFRTVLNSGVFGHPNGFGATLFVLSVFPALMFYRGSLASRVPIACILLFASVMLFTSSSRGSMGAAFVFLGALLYQRAGKLGRAGMVAMSLGGLLVLATLLRSFAYGELERRSFELFGKRMDTGRGQMWIQLLALAQQRPILGYGPGGSFSEFNDGLSAHSVYLQVLFDAGVPALLLLLLLLRFILSRVRQHLREDPHDRTALVGFAFLAAMGAHGLVEVSWFGNFLPGTFVFWTLSGLMLSRSQGYHLPSFAAGTGRAVESYA